MSVGAPLFEEGQSTVATMLSSSSPDAPGRFIAQTQADSCVARGVGEDTHKSRSFAIFVSGLILVCGLSVFIGVAAPLGSFAHDTLFLLGNADRIVQGQIPHRDFSSAWGPIIFLIYAVGLLLSDMHPVGIGYANALFGAAIAVWTFLIVRSKSSSPIACALGIYAALLINAPFSISFSPLDFGYAMIYNRYGYAIFGIIIVECVAANRQPERAWIRQDTVGAVSTGVALGLLTFLKISYAIVAVPFIIVTSFSSATERMRRLVALFVGFAVVALLILSYLRFDLMDMLSDLITAATARQIALQFSRPLAIIDWVQIISILSFAGLSYYAASRAGSGAAVRFHGVLLALLSVLIGYVLLVTNQQMNTFPLNAYTAAALIASAGPLTTRGFPILPDLTPALKGWLLGICILPLCMQNGISLAGAAFERQWPVIPHVASTIPSERGSYLLFRPVTGLIETETSGSEYVEALEDGMELIRRHSERDGVLTFDEFNPFNYLLDRPSPRGGIAAAAYDYIISATAHPTADQFLGNTSYVMVRKYKNDGWDPSEVGDVLGLMRLYGSALRTQFTVVEETKHWVLWHRK